MNEQLIFLSMVAIFLAGAWVCERDRTSEPSEEPRAQGPEGGTPE